MIRAITREEPLRCRYKPYEHMVVSPYDSEVRWTPVPEKDGNVEAPL